MPESRGDKDYQLPINGLNTEQNLLYFPMEFVPDCVNIEVDYNPQSVRVRRGMDTSGLPRLAETRNSNSHAIAITSYLWESPGQDKDLNWVVVQIGRWLYFFDASALDDPTVAIHSERYDMNSALSGTSKGTLANLEGTPCIMSNMKGKLVVTNGAIDPVVIDYDGANISPVILTLQIRDTIGLEDGLEVDEHPGSLSEEHEYNLYNQGWYKQRRLTSGSTTESDPIADYNTKWSEYPSNADIVWVGMVEDAGDLIFDSERLRDNTFGSTPAPRGHYIVDAFSIDRETIRLSPGDSGGTTGGSSGDGGGGGTFIGDGTSDPGEVLP